MNRIHKGFRNCRISRSVRTSAGGGRVPVTSCCARAVVVSARLGFAATAGPAGRSIVERTVDSMLTFKILATLDMD